MTWITEKEVEREIKKKNYKGDQFCWNEKMKIYNGGEKMRNATGHQGANQQH